MLESSLLVSSSLNFDYDLSYLHGGVNLPSTIEQFFFIFCFIFAFGAWSCLNYFFYSCSVLLNKKH